jgi:plastocyanin
MNGTHMKTLGFIVAWTLAACAFGAHASEPVSIEIKKFLFTPKEITVKPGTTIVWTNRDETPHTIIASDGSFLSKAMDTDDRYEHTFAGEGDFGYLCTLHPYMTGIVHVRK